MKLNLTERFAVLGVLPTETNFANLKIVRDLQDTLSPDDAEATKLGLKSTQIGENVRTTWNIKEGAKEKEIKVGEMATALVKEELEKLDKANKLTSDHFSIYEKFVK